MTQRAVLDAMQDAELGKRVLFVAQTQGKVRSLFLDLVDTLDLTEHDVSIRRTHGVESVSYPRGGRVDFISAGGNGHRGKSAHRIYVPTEISEEQEASLLPCLSTTRDCDMVWYIA